ncbi:MAG: ImmA/IrrE family metallo-endopeptidase [Caulobacterales bacterium]
MPALVLDLMELADIGGQPRKLAGELHRQIRAQNGDLMLPMPLRDIAHALGIEEIQEQPTTTFEGMLVAPPDKSRGVIVLRQGMQKGRRNFTLGHEIGHFTNPYHKPPPDGFMCSAPDMRARRADGKAWDRRTPYERMEIEANEFSVALMVPAPEYRKARDKLSGCDLLHIEPLANLFGTSKQVMARIYVDTAPEQIAILISRHGRLENFVLPLKFPYLGLAKGHPLPPRSSSPSFLETASPGQASGLAPVHPDAWLDRSTAGVSLCEQTLAQRDGWAMTLLALDEPDDDEQDEEEEVERRWSEPRFAYNR